MNNTDNLDHPGRPVNTEDLERLEKLIDSAWGAAYTLETTLAEHEGQDNYMTHAAGGIGETLGMARPLVAEIMRQALKGASERARETEENDNA